MSKVFAVSEIDAQQTIDRFVSENFPESYAIFSQYGNRSQTKTERFTTVPFMMLNGSMQWKVPLKAATMGDFLKTFEIQNHETVTVENGLGGKALLYVEVDQLFHLAVSQRAGKAGLSAVDEARDHGVGAACGGDLRPGHGGRSRGLCSRRGVLVVALEKPRTGPEGEGAFGRDAAAQFKVGTNFFGVGDAGGQHIQRYPDVVFLGDAQLGKDELRHRDGVALELFETVYHLLSPLSASSSFGGGDQGSQSRMEGRCFQSARSVL